METNLNKKPINNATMFKSYYVVWKPDVPGNLKITDIVFKSYYVVWKLQTQREYLNNMKV